MWCYSQNDLPGSAIEGRALTLTERFLSFSEERFKLDRGIFKFFQRRDRGSTEESLSFSRGEPRF